LTQRANGADGVADGNDAAGDGSAGLSRPLAAVLAFVPGLAVHGSGQFALGNHDAAYRLLALQGVGAALALAGILPLLLSSASRDGTGPLTALAITGASLTSTSWLADAYCTMVPPELRGAPELRSPTVEAEIGYRYVHHPSVSYGNVLVNQLDVRIGGLRLEPSAWLAFNGATATYRLLVGYRYLGPRASPEPTAHSGSFFEIDAAATTHLFPIEGFDLSTAELFPNGRLDLSDLSADLAGAYSELGLGFALEHFDFRAVSASKLGSENTLDLLARFGFGFYLGGPVAPVGELTLYYDHRHDDFAGGMAQTLAGFAGHFGADAKLYLTDQLGLRAELQVGGAILGGLSVLVRSQVMP